MSIAIVGPQKYDFQDFVCIEMMLRFHDRVGMQFHVEPTDGEDALMVFADDTPVSRVEIQVKGAKGAVTLDTVAECLAHFPGFESSNSLFERLMHDVNRFVVLVLSGRCNDAASIYRSSLEWKGDAHSSSTVRVRDASALLTAIANILTPGKDTNALDVARHEHLQKVAKSVKAANVRAALRRLIVIEQVDDGVLINQCENLLRKRHRIPSDHTADVITKLRVPVKSAKSTRIDAFVEFRSELAKSMPKDLRPSGYILRGKEQEWVKTLSRTGVLLLSGPPRVGKTNAARWIAAEFQEKGYEVKETFDIDSAERFLLEPVDANRLALLDDPLGGAHPATNPTREMSRLNALIPRLGLNRKLIVAQAQDRLLAEIRKYKLNDASIASAPWQDLGEHSSRFLSELWQQLKERYGVAEPLFTTMAQALLTGATNLEAGCLLHLAVHHSRLEGQQDLNCAIRLAREDASDLGKSLAAEGFKQILMSLAISTGPGQPVAKQEIAFILGLGGDKLLSVSVIKGSMFEIGAAEPLQPIPTYDQPLQLPIGDEQILEKLELRRIVELSEQETVSFTHPFYRSAAEILFDGSTRLSETSIRTLLEPPRANMT